MQYFLHVGISREFGYEEEEFFFNGDTLKSMFHGIVSTVRYYASRANYADAWDARAELFNEATGDYICTIVATADGESEIYREMWDECYCC